MHTLKNENSKTENLKQKSGQRVSVSDESRKGQNRLNKNILNANRSILQRMAIRQNISPKYAPMFPSYQVAKEDDQLEKEADQVATKVINTPNKPQAPRKQVINTQPQDS